MSQTTLREAELQKRDALHAQGLEALSTGERMKAKRFLTQALLANPGDALSHSHLAYTMLLENECEMAHILYSKAVELDPNLAIAYHGLAEVHEKMGDAAGAESFRMRGLRLRPVTTLRYTGSSKPIDVLLLGAQGSSNIDTKRFFNPEIFRVHALAVEYFPVGHVLPHFDVCFNAIGEADRAHGSLLRARELLEHSTARILNHPDIVLRTGRVAMSNLLKGINGVRTPNIICLSRHELASGELATTLETHGILYPFLLRTPGQHTGMHFVQITQPSDITVALQNLPGNEFFAIEFLDARGSDGLIRKYRVMAIAGELYPIHLAIASQWKVHYFSGKTDQLAVHREEEALFLESMPTVLGPLTMARLKGIVRLFGLDYGGIDFSIATDGSLLVYEANATMGFAEPSQNPKAEYRRPAIQRAQQAVEKMLR